jgi:cAMP-dependent protein kinase regulator
MSTSRSAFKDMRSMWEKKATNDKTGAAPFQKGPEKLKSMLIKSNEDAIKAYRTRFTGKNFAEKTPSRGMSVYNRPAQLNNVFGAKLEDVSGFKHPVFEKSDSDAATIRKSISDNIFFMDLTDTEQEVFIDAFEPVTKEKGVNIINQGEKGDYFYVLAEGQVTFLVEEESIGSAESGACFGDLAVLYTCPRAATVRCESDPTKLFRVDQRTFRSLLQKQSKIMETEKLQLLRSVDFLNDIDSTDLKRLSAAMTARSIHPGETLVKKGSAGDVFYVVADGELEVTDISLGSILFDDAKLTKGDYFGERALATDGPRAANITATKAGVVFSIDKPTFEKLLGNFSRLIMKSQDKIIMVSLYLWFLTTSWKEL